MRSSTLVSCPALDCPDVLIRRFEVPRVEVDPQSIRIVLVSEAPPTDPAEGYYAAGSPLYAETTVQAFRDAGCDVESIADVQALGVYLTTALKCAKKTGRISASTINSCSSLLQRELDLMPGVRVYLLMGDVAIAALNAIGRRSGQGRIIPAGSTYKVRGREFWYRGARVLPSYLQAGPAFYIEKSKRHMIAEDIALAVTLAAR